MCVGRRGGNTIRGYGPPNFSRTYPGKANSPEQSAPKETSVNRWTPDGSSAALTHAGGLSHFWLFYMEEAAGLQMGFKVGVVLYSPPRNRDVQMKSEAGFVLRGCPKVTARHRDVCPCM